MGFRIKNQSLNSDGCEALMVCTPVMTNGRVLNKIWVESKLSQSLFVLINSEANDCPFLVEIRTNHFVSEGYHWFDMQFTSHEIPVDGYLQNRIIRNKILFIFSIFANYP